MRKQNYKTAIKNETKTGTMVNDSTNRKLTNCSENKSSRSIKETILNLKIMNKAYQKTLEKKHAGSMSWTVQAVKPKLHSKLVQQNVRQLFELCSQIELRKTDEIHSNLHLYVER